MQYVSETFLGGRGGRGGFSQSFSAPKITAVGREWLSSGSPLVLCLPDEMRKEDLVLQAHQKRMKILQEQRAAMLASKSEKDDEVEALYRSLREARKEVALLNDMPPDALVSDLTLREIAATRPPHEAQLGRISGMPKAAIDIFGTAFISSLTNFCGAAKHIKMGAGAEWLNSGR
eukprot:gene31840-7046_t